MACWRRLLVVLLGLVMAAGARPAAAAESDTDLPGELRGKTFEDLEKPARELLAKGMWSEAVEEYQRLLDEVGDRLIPLGPDRQLCVHVRRLCHQRIAALPAEALRLYRNRVDAQARKWLEEGTARRDAVLLQRVVDYAFCSRSGDQALLLLGDRAFERGR